MVIFKNDDDSYRAWLIANPDGFVLNSERVPVARCLKLHRAGCVHIKAWADRNPTSTGYIKVCSPDVPPLEEWARSATRGGTLDPCPTCQSLGESGPGSAAPELSTGAHRPADLTANRDLLARFSAAVEELDHHFARNPERLADRNVDAELRRWLDGVGSPLAWAGQQVTPDEWFFITTLYGQRNREQQRSLIRQYFPLFISEVKRDVRNLTLEVMRTWVLDQEWMKPRLVMMGTILREQGLTMQGYVDHLRLIDGQATPRNPMPALDAIVRDHRATSWKTLSVSVCDCAGGNCFPIDSRVRKELERHGLPSAVEAERLLVSLSLAVGRNPRQMPGCFMRLAAAAAISRRDSMTKFQKRSLPWQRSRIASQF